jgi:hypothetical protein
MKPSKTWLIAISTAIAGALTTHLSWLLQEEHPVRSSDLASEVKCEPRVEHVCQGDPPSENAPRNANQAEPARVEPAPPTPVLPHTVFGMGGGWNPIAQLSAEQRKTMVRHRYGALLRELALSPSQRESLLNVLSEQQARSAFVPRRDSGSAQAAAAAASREQHEIAAAIGDEKAAAFEQLKDTMSVREELRSVRDQLEEAGEPMTAEQYRALIGAMTALGLERPPHPGEATSREEAAELYRNWVTDRDEMLRESAAKTLEPAQLKMLDEGQELREAMRPQLGVSFEALRAQARPGG